jgi:putative transposase
MLAFISSFFHGSLVGFAAARNWSLRSLRSATSWQSLHRQRPGCPQLFALDRLFWLSRKATDAFPWDTAPRFLLRDRDTSYCSVFRKRVEVMGITEVVTAPRSPWQNAYVERVIGSVRRECLDYVVIFNQRHLRRVLASYVDYYYRTRTHLSLDKDRPDSRPVQPPTRGKVIAIPQVGGLHHRYERLAA